MPSVQRTRSGHCILGETERRKMVRLVGLYPESQVCELIGGISRHTLGRLVGGLPVMKGTIAIVQQALDGLRIEEQR